MDLQQASEQLARAMEEPTDAKAAQEVLQRVPELANTSNRYGETPLHIAAELEGQQGLGVVRALLAAGADPNARESGDGQTPLMYAVAAGKFATADAMLRAGADWEAQDKDGHKARDLPGALESGDAEQVAALSRLAETAAAVASERSACGGGAAS